MNKYVYICMYIIEEGEDKERRNREEIPIFDANKELSN